MADRNIFDFRREAAKPVERRRRKDWVVRSVSVIALFGWLLAIMSLITVRIAQPRGDDYFTRVYGSSIIGFWNTPMLRVSFLALLLSFMSCLIGMIANMMRHRRKSDRFNKSVITLAILSLLGCVAFLVNYSYLI